MTTKTFVARLAELPEVLRFVRSQLDQTSLKGPDKMRLELAMEEAVVNVIHHAKVEHFSLSASKSGAEIAFELVDKGPAFNPLTHPTQKNEIPLEKLPPGGKGLVLMRKCTDALLYRREEGTNILTMIKKLSPSSQ